MRCRGAIASAVITFALLGCGGSEALSRSEFVKKANAVCLRAVDAAEAGQAHGIEEYAAKVLAVEGSKLEGIRALKPPAELRAKYEEYERALHDRTVFFERVLDGIRAHRRLSNGDSVKAVELQTAERERASALHLTKC
jgi:hypothetical protein